MTDKALGVAMGLAGALVVGVLVALGLDLCRASTTGPQWRRRMVAAGLVLLAGLGVSWSGQGATLEAGATAHQDDRQEGDDLMRTEEWQRIAKVWPEAEEIASGKRGAFPFNAEEKQRLIERLNDAKKDVVKLGTTGLLSDPEASLLSKDLDLLVTGVQGKRPKEMQNATCYLPMMIRPAQESAKRLQERMDLLEALARSSTLHGEVVLKVLTQVRKDVEVLYQNKELERLKPEEIAQAKEIRERARALASELEKKAGRAPVE